MQPEETEILFWNRLMAAADAMACETASPGEVYAQLLALEEGFLTQFDPADTFPAYASVKLCQALRKHLDRQG